MAFPSQNPSFRVGTTIVSIPRCPLPELAGLLRQPVPEGVPAATLEFQATERADWQTGLEREGARFRRAVASHQCEIDFLARRVVVRCLAQLDRVGLYLLFRDVFAALCGLSGDVLLHASSVVRDGRAIAFCAFSGGGKSTIARLLEPDGETISDEVNWAFRDSQGAFRLVDQRYYRAPPTAPAPDVPLAGVYLLYQAAACATSPVTATEAYPILLAAPFGDDPLLPRRAQAAAALFARIPVRRLAFNLQPDEVRRAVWGEAPSHA